MSSESTILAHPVSQFFYYAVLSTIPYYYWRQSTPVIPADWYLTIVLVLIVLLYLVSRKNLPPMVFNNLNSWLLLFLFVNIISNLMSPYQGDAFSGMVVLGQIYVFIFLNLVFLTEKGLSTTLPLVLGLSVGFNGLIAGLEYFFGIRLFTVGDVATGYEVVAGKSYGVSIGANNVALMSIFVIPPMVYKIFHAQSPTRLLGWLALILLNITGLISSESRAGFLIFLITLIMVLFANKDRFQPRFLGLAISFVGLCFLLVATAIPDSYFARQQTLLAEEPDVSLQRRQAYIRVGLESFFDRPILGTGTFTFPTVWVNSTEARFFKMTERGAHNTYLDTLVGVGIIGLLVLFGLFFRVFRDFLTAIKNFDLIRDDHMKELTKAYLISFLAVVFYCLFKTLLDHKFLILILSISQVIFFISEKKKEQQYGPA